MVQQKVKVDRLLNISRVLGVALETLLQHIRHRLSHTLAETHD